LSDWNYADALPAEPRASGNGVVIAAVVACVLLLAILLFSFRETIGRSLISLGQSLSSPSSPPSDSSQAEVPDNPKPAEDPQTPANAAKENNSASNGGDNSSPSQGPTKGEKPQTVRPQADREKPAPPPANEEQFRDEKPAPPTDAGAAKPIHSQDPAEEVRSLWSAVGQGNTAAEVTLAKLYMIGGGVPKNCDQARVLLKAAVKKGNAEAVSTLSQLNRQGCP
jgi:TPR repeat protein